MQITWNTSDLVPAAFVVTIRLQKRHTSEQLRLDMESHILELVKSLLTSGPYRFVEDVTVNSIASETN